MGWKEDARRSIIGKKKELISFPGYWVQARKYSTQGKDEIADATRAVQKGIDKKVLFSAAKKMKGKENLTEDQIFDMLSAEEISELVDSSSCAATELFKAKIKNGLNAHNFCDGDIETRSTEKDIKGFANDILEFEEVALEIIGIIEDFNRPLALATPSISKMLPNGSTKEQSSNTVMSGQEEENQPS